MSYNGSGTFLINSAGQPVVANTVISATVFNALTSDLATGLSTAITKDGQTTITNNIPFGSNKITGLGSGTAAADAANLGQVQSTVAKLITVTGTDTITGSMSPQLTAYAAGQLFYFVANAANTGAVTLNIDSLGAKSITRDGSSALAAGDINSGEVVVVIYDGTRFQMINAANSFGNTTINGTLAVTGNAGFQANVSITSALSVGGVFAVTGAATFTANPTLSGGTANGVLYLNGSKVATSGTGLAYDGTNFSLGAAWTNNPMRPTTAPLYFQYASTGNNILAVMGDNVVSSVQVNRFSDNTTAPNINMGKARGTYASPTAVQTGDFLGNLQFRGYGGTTSRILASIDGLVETYTSDTNIASALSFATSSSGVASATEKMRLDSSGNLGIGTTSWPSAQRLRVAGGDVGFEGQFLYLVNANADIQLGAGQNSKITNTDSTNTLSIARTGASSIITLSTAGSERARITSGGTFAIGTTSPLTTAKLYVSAGTGKNFLVQDSGTANLVELSNYSTADGVQEIALGGSVLRFYTGTAGGGSTTERARITAAGNVGIGTSSPDQKLVVDNGGSSVYIKVTGQSVDGYFGQDGVGLAVYQAGNKPIYFSTNSAERARITADGALLVGGTSTLGSATGVIGIGSSGMTLAKQTSNLANNGTLDITVGSSGGSGYMGFLTVSNINNANAGINTQTTYSVIGRGTTATFTSLASVNGPTSGASFTVTVPSNGVIRVTNTSGSATDVYIAFFGTSTG